MHGMLRNQILVQWTKCVSCLVLHSEFGSGSKVPGTPTNYQSLCSVEFSLPHFDGMCCCYPDSFWVTFDFFTLPSQTNASTMQHLGQRHEDIQWRTQWDSSGQTGQEQSKCFGRLSLILLGDPISTDMSWASERWKHSLPVWNFYGNPPEWHLFPDAPALFGQPARVCSWGKLDALHKEFSEKEKLLQCGPVVK